MRKLILLVASAFTVFCCIVLAEQPDMIMKSGGGHPGSTGAPGEETCATAGCHANATISPGDGVNNFQLGNNATTYTPGQTYPIKITAQKAGINRFGFEVVALDKNNKNIGTWKITESTRTQIINATINGGQRLYVTHKVNGTKPVSSGKGEWTFNWTAPANYTDSVKFYYVTNATNNDNTNQGDALYLSSVAFAASAPNSVKEENETAHISVYPNPAINFLTVKNAEGSEIEIFDITGNLKFSQRRLANNDYHISLEELLAGKYFVRIITPDKQKRTLSFIKN